MSRPIDAHYCDHLGRPEGGCSSGVGYTISWQRGPCPSPEARNGAFLIEVLESCEKRLAYYQSSEFACDENADALVFLAESIASLKSRLDRRRDAGTLGTHKPDERAGGAS